jgi:hypothetical protein
VKRLTAEVAAVEAELAGWRAAGAARARRAGGAAQGDRGQEHADRIAGKIDATKASLVTVKGRAAPGGGGGRVAALRADRTAVQRDEPHAAELDAVARIASSRPGGPRRARLERTRSELAATSGSCRSASAWSALTRR